MADGGRIEHDDIGEVARQEAAPVAQPVETGRDIGQELHGPLPAEQAAGPHPVTQHGGRIDRPAHGVQMRAGVGATHDGPWVLPHSGPQHPVILGFADGWAQSRSELICHHHVEEGVEGIQATLTGHVPHAPAFDAGVLRVRRSRQ